MNRIPHGTGNAREIGATFLRCYVGTRARDAREAVLEPFQSGCMHVCIHASTHARKQECTIARMHESTFARKHDRIHACTSHSHILIFAYSHVCNYSASQTQRARARCGSYVSVVVCA